MNRVALYGRLPEIYRIRDAEQEPAGQLKAYLAAVETVFDAIHENIEALYDDLFIETCDPWVIPYIGDLLGVSHLSGETRTLRADVADTIALRRRKGTLSAIERLASNLTGWPARAVEMRPNLAWAVHLNHQRPDAGGLPPWGGDAQRPAAPRRGGTVSLRDPATLSLIGTPFDAFAYTPDVRPLEEGTRRINLPNLMISLWRLRAYRLNVTLPLVKGVESLGAPPAGSGQAHFALRIDLDPLDRPVRLFNVWRRPKTDPATGTAPLTMPDAAPAPIMRARLDEAAGAGNAWAYVSIDSFNTIAGVPQGLDLGDVGLQIYLPDTFPPGAKWRIRGANLCAWEDGLDGALLTHDMVIDPLIGRMVIGLASAAERDALVSAAQDRTPRFFIGYTYGTPGPFGAHPVSRHHTTAPEAELRIINRLDPAAPTLQAALNDLSTRATPLIVQIDDSLVHELDPATLPGSLVENGIGSLRLNQSLTIRAASGHRPVIRLATPLAFRPVQPGAALVSALKVRLEGLFITGGTLDPARPLIARAAVARLELDGVTLDPGGHRQRDGASAPGRTGMFLVNDYGFADPADADAFEPTPDIVITRSITGGLLIDDSYELSLQDSLVDGGGAPGKAEHVALGPATAALGYAARLSFRGVTFVGTTHTREARGQGAIFCQRLDVWNHQVGCIKLSALASNVNRLPPNYGCLVGADVRLSFTSLTHGDPGYGQLAAGVDRRLTNLGPGDEAMGTTNFLMEAHARANLALRLREYLPVGTQATLIFET